MKLEIQSLNLNKMIESFMIAITNKVGGGDDAVGNVLKWIMKLQQTVMDN